MNFGRHRERPARATYRPPEPMPQTAEAAHAVAKQWYKAMLYHAAGGRERQTATAAACFQNAALLAQMYEARQQRIALIKLLRAHGMDAVDERDLHPATPKVPYDGYRVTVPGRMR